MNPNTPAQVRLLERAVNSNKRISDAHENKNTIAALVRKGMLVHEDRFPSFNTYKLTHFGVLVARKHGIEV